MDGWGGGEKEDEEEKRCIVEHGAAVVVVKAVHDGLERSMDGGRVDGGGGLCGRTK